MDAREQGPPNGLAEERVAAAFDHFDLRADLRGEAARRVGMRDRIARTGDDEDGQRRAKDGAISQPSSRQPLEHRRWLAHPGVAGRVSRAGRRPAGRESGPAAPAREPAAGIFKNVRIADRRRDERRGWRRPRPRSLPAQRQERA